MEVKIEHIALYGRSSEVINEVLLHEIYGDNISLDHGEKTDSVVFATAIKL